jgi:hypothetical protein
VRVASPGAVPVPLGEGGDAGGVCEAPADSQRAERGRLRTGVPPSEALGEPEHTAGAFWRARRALGRRVRATHPRRLRLLCRWPWGWATTARFRLLTGEDAAPPLGVAGALGEPLLLPLCDATAAVGDGRSEAEAEARALAQHAGDALSLPLPRSVAVGAAGEALAPPLGESGPAEAKPPAEARAASVAVRGALAEAAAQTEAEAQRVALGESRAAEAGGKGVSLGKPLGETGGFVRGRRRSAAARRGGAASRWAAAWAR